ncbi:hypothetical protein V8C86DRAFT_1019367 [Haematococcus lacustris]
MYSTSSCLSTCCNGDSPAELAACCAACCSQAKSSCSCMAACRAALLLVRSCSCAGAEAAQSNRRCVSFWRAAVSERSLLTAHLTQPFVPFGAGAGRRMQAYQACIAQLPQVPTVPIPPPVAQDDQHASWQVGAALVLTVDDFKCCPPFILLRRARKNRHDPNEPSPRRAEIHQRLRAARQLLFLLRFLLWLGLSHLAWWQLMLRALRPTLHNLAIAV